MEFWGQLLAAIGGALGIVLILLRMAKSFLQTWVETNIEATAEKSLAKYSDTLQRHTMAYEMILQKEFTFFECASKFTSMVFLGSEDSQYHLGLRTSAQIDFVAAECDVVTILKNTSEFKSSLLIAHPYLTFAISAAATALIDFIDGEYYQTVEDILSNQGKFDEEAKMKFKDINMELTSRCAFLNGAIGTRLNELCK